MGSSQSSPTSAADKGPTPTGFGVRVTPKAVESVTGHAAATPTPVAAPTDEETTELLQRAFQQGMEYALQHQNEQQEAQRLSALEAQQKANEQQESALRERIEALQQREYRAPAQPMGCMEERQATLVCYRTMRGAPAGEVVSKCQKAVDDLERCAVLVREAALVNIAVGGKQSR